MMLTKPKQFNIKGAILAGGKATRMGGVAKGMLADESGQPIIARLINQMHVAGISDIVIAANDPNPYMDLNVQTVPDLKKGMGPIAGIAAVLKHFKDQCDGVMFIPCDVPNITARELIALKEVFIHSTEKVVFAETDEFFWHPLCAVVHNDLADQVVLALNLGQRKVGQLWRQLRALRPQPLGCGGPRA
jgi:molybdopterin-guanine dinucleotide biosynthesis protein A